MRAGIKGLIISAAFIGPGTVTTASIVGAQSAFTLLYLLIFAILATYILQEMASRLGTISGMGLSEAIMQSLKLKIFRVLVGGLIIVAIGLGNAAYEGGNITGAALGLSTSLGASIQTWAIILGASAFLLLLSGHYRIVEKCLVVLVLLMSLVFITLMFVIGINTDLLSQGFNFNNDIFSNTTLALAIVGTTIVPYNLFLHSGLSASDTKLQKRLSGPNYVVDKQDMLSQNLQLFSTIGIGGLVSFAILSSAVSAFFVNQTIIDKNNIALQLEPLFGSNASLYFGLGLFAAGLSSAITAPLAAAYAISGLFSWRADLQDKRFRACALAIVLIGTILGSLGLKPLYLIVVAQSANALLLPVSVILLVWVCNREHLLGEHKNGLFGNLAALVVVLLVLFLAVNKLFL